MNENEKEGLVEAGEELAPNQEDAFSDGFDDPGAEETTDQSGSEEREQPETQGEGEETPIEGENRREDEAAEAETTAKEPPTAGQVWEVNHLGQRRTMEAKDITPELLQKGLDYDRIHQQFDRTKPVMSLISTLAQQAGVGVEDYVRMVRTEAKMSGGIGEDEAKRAVELEDREAAVSAKEEAQRGADQRREAVQTEVRKGVAEFAQAFPEIYDQARKNPEVIPQSVWEAVKGGLSLTAAYAQYAVAQAARETQEAQSKAQTAQQNQRNAQRSTGSMKSAGSDTKGKDPFLQGWDE